MDEKDRIIDKSFQTPKAVFYRLNMHVHRLTAKILQYLTDFL
jgi:hypothetical protein